MNNKDFDYLTNPYLFVERYVKQNNYDFNTLGTLIGIDSFQTTDDVLMALYEDYLKTYIGFKMSGTDLKVPKFNPSDLALAFNRQASKVAIEKFNHIKQSLFLPPAPQPDPVKKWVYHTLKNPTELDVAVYKHFFWQVKRKLLNLPIKFEMMICIKGPQGVGKTRSTKALLTPLGELATVRSLKELLDERNLYSLTKSYVNTFEELTGALKADIDALKALMSRDTNMWRRLGQNAHSLGKNNCTFISTANVSVLDTFYDPTGMRRFYEVDFVDSLSLLDTTYINDPDTAIQIWRSVDHQAECFVEPFMKELALVQDKLRRASVYEEFFNNNHYEVTEEFNLKANDLMVDFQDFLRRTNPGMRASLTISKIKSVPGFEGVEAKKRSVMFYNLKKITNAKDKELK